MIGGKEKVQDLSQLLFADDTIVMADSEKLTKTGEGVWA